MSKEKEKDKQDEYRVPKIIPSLALSTFGSIGLILLLIVSGFYEGSVSAVLGFLFRGSLFVIVAFFGMFFGVFESLRRIDKPPHPESLIDFLLSTVCFVVISIMGVLCMYTIIVSVNYWWWLITVVVLGGLSAMSHGWHIYFQRTHIMIKYEMDKLKGMKGKNAREIFVKSHELEHSYFQTYLTAFVSATVLFFTAAIVGYFLKSVEIKPLSLINASIMAIWFIAGMFWGTFIPITKHLEWIRQQIRYIALNGPEKR